MVTPIFHKIQFFLPKKRVSLSSGDAREKYESTRWLEKSKPYEC